MQNLKKKCICFKKTKILKKKAIENEFKIFTEKRMKKKAGQ